MERLLTKKFLPLFLSVCMIFSVLSTTFMVTAEGSGVSEKTEINYVSLGDSMTNGYTLPGYGIKGENYRGFLQVIPEAYPARFAAWLAGFNGEIQKDQTVFEGPDAVVNLTQLATSSMRADDVYYFLNYGTEHAVEWDKYGKAIFTSLEVFKTAYGVNKLGLSSKDAAELPYTEHYEEIMAYAAKEYQQAIKDADVISVGVGANNFATFMLLRVSDWFGLGTYPGDFNFKDLISDLSPEMLAEIDEIYNKVESLLMESAAEQGLPLDIEFAGATLGDLVADFANSLAYTTAGFALGYKGILDTIIRENDDAEIIIVGLTNGFKGITFGIPMGEDVYEFPMGDMLDVVYKFIDAYMAGLPAVYEGEAKAGGVELQPIYYADTNADDVGKIEILIDQIRANADIDLGSLYGDVDAATAFAGSFDSSALPEGTVRSLILERIGEMMIQKIPVASTEPSSDSMEPPTLEELDDLGSDPSEIEIYNYYLDKYPDDHEMHKKVTGCIVYLGIEKAMIASTNVDVLNLKDLSLLADTEALISQIGSIVGNGFLTVNGVAGAMIANAELMTVYNIIFRFLVGYGAITHTSANGHETIANVIIDAYENEHTAFDETLENLEYVLYLITEYYDDAYAYGYAYADENGYVDIAAGAIDKAIAAVEAAIIVVEEAEDEFGYEYPNAFAELNAIIDTLEELQAALYNDDMATVPGLIDTIYALEDDLYVHLANIAAIYGVLEDAAIEQLGIALDALELYIEEELIPALEELAKLTIELMYYMATNPTYVRDEDSLYIAFGDSSAASTSYVELLAAFIGVPYSNVSYAGLSYSTLLEGLTELDPEPLAVIAGADLITLGFSPSFGIIEALNDFIAEEENDYASAWTELLGEEAAYVIGEYFAALEEDLADLNIYEMTGIDNAEGLLVSAIQGYVYGVISDMVAMPEVVSLLRELSPNATIVVLNMYDPFKDVVIDLGSVQLPLGDVTNAVIAAAGIEGLAYAMLTQKCNFVNITDVEIGLEDTTLDLFDIITEFVMNGGTALNPTVKGHFEIVEQIFDKMNLIFDYPLGDVDMDWDVDHVDAMLTLQYYSGTITEDALNLDVADVNGDGEINHVDAMLILQLYSGVITEFPYVEPDIDIEFDSDEELAA